MSMREKSKVHRIIFWLVKSVALRHKECSKFWRTGLCKFCCKAKRYNWLLSKERLRGNLANNIESDLCRNFKEILNKFQERTKKPKENNEKNVGNCKQLSSSIDLV